MRPHKSALILQNSHFAAACADFAEAKPRIFRDNFVDKMGAANGTSCLGQPGSIPVSRPTIITTAIMVEIASNSDGSSFVMASSSRAGREGSLPSLC